MPQLEGAGRHSLILTLAIMEYSAYLSFVQNKPCLYEQDSLSSTFQERHSLLLYCHKIPWFLSKKLSCLLNWRFVSQSQELFSWAWLKASTEACGWGEKVWGEAGLHVLMLAWKFACWGITLLSWPLVSLWLDRDEVFSKILLAVKF